MHQTSQGTVTDRVSYSSAQGMEVRNAFWTALPQTGRGTAPPVNVIKTHTVSFIATSGCQVTNLGAWERGKEHHFACLIPAQHFPFPGNFSFLANSFIGGFKHFYTQCQRKHQRMEGSLQFDLKPACSSPGHILDLCRLHNGHRHLAEGTWVGRGRQRRGVQPMPALGESPQG